MPYVELLPHLICNSLVTIVPLKPIQSPYSKSYDPNAKCEYHAGAMGHATEIQDLIDMGWLSFKKNSLNIDNNPLLEHNSSSINAITGEGDYMVKRAEEVQTPMKDVFRELGLMNVGLVQVDKQRSEGIVTVHEENKGGINAPRPLIIHFTPSTNGLKPLEIRIPIPFPYKDSKAIPWRYDVEI
ncbi:hypothetical protein CR513_49506, partial [Mucuna pruriens]